MTSVVQFNNSLQELVLQGRIHCGVLSSLDYNGFNVTPMTLVFFTLYMAAGWFSARTVGLQIRGSLI